MQPKSQKLTYATFIYDCTSPSDFLINYNLVFGMLGTVSTVKPHVPQGYAPGPPGALTYV